MAGSNRTELELLLKSCSDDPEKLESAKYLIRNMTYHWSYAEPAYSAFCDSLCLYVPDGAIDEEQTSRANVYIDSVEAGLKRTYDIRTLSARYLYDNIEEALRQWHESQYLSHLDFDQFCEYVLPYKVVDGQPCDDWREYAKLPGGVVSDTLSLIDDFNGSVRMAVYDANLTLAKSFKERKCEYIPNLHSPDNIFSFKTLVALPYATCSEMSNLGEISCRANGLPVAYDFTPQYADRGASHSWNYLLSAMRRDCDYVPFEGIPGMGHCLDDRFSKIYRRTYVPDPVRLKALLRGIPLPGSVSDIYVKDVTSSYCKTTTLKMRTEIKCRMVYLSVFDDTSWLPIALANKKGRRSVFQDVAVGNTYMLLGQNRQGKLIPVSRPFRIKYNGDINFFPEEGLVMNTMRIDRKYPAFSHIWDCRKDLGPAVLKGSNDYKFRKVQQYFEFDGLLFSEEKRDSNPEPLRFWKLEAAGITPSCIAEVYFYSDGQRVKPMAVEVSPEYDERELFRDYAVCDDNTLSYFKFIKDSTWIKFQFPEPVKIDCAAIIRRGDGNDIQPGDTYELSVWREGSFTLIGSVVADKTYIDFKDVPQDVVLYIKDISNGKQNRTFTVHDGAIIWL